MRAPRQQSPSSPSSSPEHRGGGSPEPRSSGRREWRTEELNTAILVLAPILFWGDAPPTTSLVHFPCLTHSLLGPSSVRCSPVWLALPSHTDITLFSAGPAPSLASELLTRATGATRHLLSSLQTPSLSHTRPQCPPTDPPTLILWWTRNGFKLKARKGKETERQRGREGLRGTLATFLPSHRIKQREISIQGCLGCLGAGKASSSEDPRSTRGQSLLPRAWSQRRQPRLS